MRILSIKEASSPSSHVPVEITDFLVIVIFVSAVIFAGYYIWKVSWWKTDMGWNILAFDCAIAIITLPQVLHIFLGINYLSAFYQWLTSVMLVLVLFLINHRTYMLHREQRKGRSRTVIRVTSEQRDTRSGTP